MKVSSMSVCVTKLSSDEGLAAFRAVCTPFGSLEPAADALHQLLVKYLEKQEAKAVTAAAILETLWRVEEDAAATVAFNVGRVIFTTPTSKTEIEIGRYAGGYHIEMRFPRPSSVRADTVRDSARANGVEFEEQAA